MSIRVTVVHLNPSAPDLLRVVARIPVDMARTVKANVEQGGRKAANNSRRTSGTHGKHHPASITAEMTGVMQGEWGPDRAKPQGDMDFEYGSGNQTAPHLPVTKSGDVQVPKWHRDTSKAIDRWFW